MPRSTNFVLNQEQEGRLITFLMEKHTALLQDNGDRMTKDREAWDRYNLEVKEREARNDEIYTLSNIPVPVYAMIMEHFVSRSEDSTTGDKPYFHFDAVGVQGEVNAMRYDRYFNWKLDEQGKVHDALQDNQLPVFIQCAAIQKAVYTKDVCRWIDRDKLVLHDRASGEVIEIANHGPIIKDEDQWTEQLDPVQPAAKPGRGANPATRMHLNADPSFVLDPKKHAWKKPADGLKRSYTIYAGAKSENVAYDRFLCPSDAESVDAADVVQEMQDRNFTWFYDQWIERPWCRWRDKVGIFKAGDATSKADKGSMVAGQKKTEDTKAGQVRDTINPIRKVIECWVRRDVLGDGTGAPQEFVCWLDPEARLLVFYEWVAKICPDMKRPYTVTAIRKLPKRWYGKSIWEVGKRIFESIDRLFNGEFYRAIQQANPPKGGDPTAAVEEPEDIGADPTMYHKMKKGRTIDELLAYAKIPDTNARSQMILEYLVYWLQLWLGISNLAQGDYQAVNTNATKYGIQKTLAESSMLGRRWIRRLIAAQEEHLTKLVMITIVTLPENAQETFEFTDHDQVMTETLNNTDVRKLTVHASIVMGQGHEEQDIERAKTALSVQEKYFEQLNPPVRDAMRPLFIEILNDLGYKTAEDLLPVFDAVPVGTSSLGGDPLPALKAVAQGAMHPDSPVPLPAKDEGKKK
jgi:hypothetical protein